MLKTKMRQRYLIDNYGADEHTVELAFNTCAALAVDTSNKIWMLVDCSHSMSQNESILEILGATNHKRFFRDGIVKWKESTIHLIETDGKFETELIQTVMAAFCTKQTLDMVESWPNVLSITAFPWMPGDTETWERTYSPRLVARKRPPFKPML